MKIGIDFGGTKTEGILIDSSGKELNRERIKTEKNYDGTINGILSIIKNFENSFGVVESIGIGMPGAGLQKSKTIQQCLILKLLNFEIIEFFDCLKKLLNESRD